MFSNLKAEMKRKGITLATFAKELQISESAVTKKLAGTYEFKFSEFRKIVQLFPNCTWEYLFENDERRDKDSA
ncbi:MAG: helix-turn-helix transcriptional regulator [Sporomusa sp.]